MSVKHLVKTEKKQCSENGEDMIKEHKAFLEQSHENNSKARGQQQGCDLNLYPRPPQGCL